MMDNEATARRRKMFKLYAANLRHFYPQFDGKLFACPICAELFDEVEVEPNGRLTIGHIWPGSAGETLECGRCNHRLGTLCDEEVTNEREHCKAVGGSGEAKVDATFRMDGGRMRAEMSLIGTKFHFREISKATNPRDRDRIINALRSGSDRTFQISFRSINTVRLGLAILHAAYLSAFRHFGYEYPLGAPVSSLRSLLLADTVPNEFPLPVIIPNDIDGAVVPPLVPFLLADASGHRLMGVRIPSPSDKMRIAVLPGFGTEAAHDFDQFKNAGRRRFNFVRLDGWPPETRLADAHWCAFGHVAWDNLVPPAK